MSLDRIKKNLFCFHDGSVEKITHFNNSIEIYVSSSEVDKDEIIGKEKISPDKIIIGKFHLEDVKSIKENDQIFSGKLKIKYDDAEIFTIKIEGNIFEISIKWCNYPPNEWTDDFSNIIIEAEKILWKNLS